MKRTRKDLVEFLYKHFENSYAMKVSDLLLEKLADKLIQEGWCKVDARSPEEKILKVLQSGESFNFKDELIEYFSAKIEDSNE